MRHKILYWEDIKAGEKLATLTREITTTAVVAARQGTSTRCTTTFALPKKQAPGISS